MEDLFAGVSTTAVVSALVVGAGLMAVINYTAFGGRKAANIAR